jgi:hypothetical protein
VPAHDDDCLAHEKSKKTTDQCKDEQGNAANKYFLSEGWSFFIDRADEFFYQDIIVCAVFLLRFPEIRCTGSIHWLVLRIACDFALFGKVYDISGYLGSENAKIIGENNENDTKQKAPPVLPEIFIE